MTSADDYVLQLLAEREIITDDDIEAALGEVRETASGEEGEADENSLALNLLIERGYTTSAQVAETLAESFNMEVVDLDSVRVDEETLKKVPASLARRYHVFPLEIDESEVKLAISDPLDVDVTDNIAQYLRKTVTPYIATTESIEKAIAGNYGQEDTSEMASFISSLDTEEEDAKNKDAAEGLDIEGLGDGDGEEGPIIRYVQMVIAEALKRRTSDIHLEPLEKEFRVRYRIDGVLHEVEGPPKRLQPAIISRIKLMSNVSIAEKRVPQDGRISAKAGGKDIDLRVSVLPTAFGESIVMRILDKEGLKLGLPELGFFSDDQAVFERIIAMPDGVFLVTGPTGSGKSTTLYSALHYINQPDRKIITVEDPVEYEMAGINQVQVRREVGMDFTSALRAMLRQAPNIIMVGEIRDKETAEIAINASLTGHMVFSTLHTNDAPSAITRLVDIGVKPFLVSASLRAAMAQRLVRKICVRCKADHIPEKKDLDAVGIRPDDVDEGNFKKGEGCASCSGTGYRGRFGVFELFTVNDEIAQMIYEERTLVELRRKALDLGMRSMRDDGIRKIMAGMTTCEEVLKSTVAAAI
ncbi:ATPase, T2SS/T4P/T4SS family [Puniceicoccus vermicola]|uniref:Flp pilus assembly complex ATPase component TadA n=1 Tax=Puniceicoccus vermicola TaxID=388746 RepID=A0A7X1AVY0_9BACT|nr:Flp pilus assembly complex ATPase component TadA [Puniceicoccus vermicola]